MNTKIYKLFAVPTAGLVLLTAAGAFAGNGGGFSFNNGRIGIQFGNGGAKIVRINGGNNGNNNGGLNNGGNNNQGNNGNNQSCGGNGNQNNGGVVNNNGTTFPGTNNNGGGSVNGGQIFGRALEPVHSTYVADAFDNLFLVSHREYGTSDAQKFIAEFNNIAPEAQLAPGQRLLLPSISVDGKMTLSKRPPAENDTFGTTASTAAAKAAQTGSSSGAVSPTTPATTPAADLPKVASGSTLQLDGTEFGAAKGAARLHVGGLSLPVEIVDWTASVTKVKLPSLEVNGTTTAELEVVRADGTVASKSGIELTPVVSGLAKAN